MSIDIGERYKIIFEEHHYGSDFRKNVAIGWAVVYAALAPTFVWVQSKSMSLSWIVPAAAFFLTLLMWGADIRNRDATNANKEVGAAIEEDPSANIPETQRYFSKLRKARFTQSRIVDAFAILTCLGFIIGTVFLFCSVGKLPS